MAEERAEVQAASPAGVDAEVEAEADTPAEVDAEVEAEAEAPAEVDAEVEAEAEAPAPAEVDAEAEAEAPAEGDAEVEAEAEAPAEVDEEAPKEEEWRRFSPKHVDSDLCMARTWSLGAGGQCSCKPSKEGKEFCTRHYLNDCWRVHGRVDGPIPDKKLREFIRTANGELGKKKKTKPNSRDAEGSNKKGEKANADPSPSKKRKSEATPPPKSSRLQRSRSSQQKEVTTPRNTKAPKKRPETRRAEKAKQPKFPKCTCGKPIHSEKCKLFRPSFLPSRRPRFPAEPRIREPLSPVKTVPPPSVKLSRVASEQVLSISEEIARLPKQQRKAAWKHQMRTYHPDKKCVFPNLNESQMNEVFVEIKRRYDFAMRTEGEHLIPPARQFWGSCR